LPPAGRRRTIDADPIATLDRGAEMSPAPKRPRTSQRKPPEDQPPTSERADTAEKRFAYEDLPEVTCLEDADPVCRPKFPDGDFTSADTENIVACADWSYILHFECAFEAMEILSAGFQDGRFPLECRVAVRMDAWLCESVNHVPAAQRRAMGARVLDGVEQLLDDLYEVLLAVYEARAGCCEEELPPAGPEATLAWSLEHIQLELSRRGAGAPAFTALRVGGELMDAFNILGSPDLARFLGGGYDVGLVDNIDRLLGDRKPDGSPRTPAYKHAELAVNSRKAIEQLAPLAVDDLKKLTMADIDGLTARLALLRAVAGRRDVHSKREQLDDAAAETAAKVIRLTRTAGSPF
jgi:hypothetical protein